MGSAFQCAGNAQGLAVSTTSYFAVSNTGLLAQVTESNAQVRYYHDGAITRLSARITARNNPGLVFFRLSVNSSVVTNAFSVPSLTTGYFTDTTHSDTIASGDDVAVKMTCLLGGTATVNAVSTNFTADTNTVVRHSFVSVRNFYNSPTEYYALSESRSVQNLTESSARTRIGADGTLKNLTINMPVNSRGGVVARLRINGANGNSVIATGTVSTGIFTDSSNTDDVVVGDDVNFLVDGGLVAGGSDTINVVVATIDWESDNNEFHILAGESSATIPAGTTDYYPLGSAASAGGAGTSTESDVQMDLNSTYTLSRLSANVGMPSGTTASIVVRQNSADSILQRRVVPSESDIVSNLVDSIVCAPTDDMSIALHGIDCYVISILCSIANETVHLQGGKILGGLIQ